jgi:hypothetical protein
MKDHCIEQEVDTALSSLEIRSLEIKTKVTISKENVKVEPMPMIFMRHVELIQEVFKEFSSNMRGLHIGLGWN